MKINRAQSEVVNIIQKCGSFLISSHVNIEGDALGSELALSLLLKKLGKSAHIANDGAMPEMYNFLPGARSISFLNFLK